MDAELARIFEGHLGGLCAGDGYESDSASDEETFIGEVQLPVFPATPSASFDVDICPPETAGADAQLDHAAFLVHAERHCDMALSSQFDEALDDHYAAILQDLDHQDECEGPESEAVDEADSSDQQRALPQLFAKGNQAAHGRKCSSKNFQASGASIESYCNQSLENACDRAMDAQYAKSLKLLETDFEGLDAYDGKVPDGETSFIEELEDALTRQAAEMFEMEVNASLCTDGALMAAFEDYNRGLLRELDGFNHEVPCANLWAMVVEKVRKVGVYLLWTI
jgi:hypothetical protein